MKLIALDLDGTTLNSKREISKENLEAIKKAQKAGHIVMALSGRSEESVRAELEKYGLDCPIGGNNGATLHVKGEMLEMHTLNRIQSEKVALKLEKEKLPYKICTDKGIFSTKEWDSRLEMVLSSGSVPEEHFRHPLFKMFTRSNKEYGQPLFNDFEEVLSREDLQIQKFIILCLEPKQRERLKVYLETIEESNVIGASPYNLEVTHVHASKGKALKRMAAYFGIPIENTVAIGDELNDISMFEAAGLSIAMGNAAEEIKKHADIVTLTNDENGVAYAFENYILKD